jgi:hypothetical protein
MSPTRSLLERRLLAVLGPSLMVTLAAGCGERVEGVQCLPLEATECPSVDEAGEIMDGWQTCSDPVEEIVRVTGFRGQESATDTGGTTTQVCCYDTTNRTIPGSSCVVGRPLVHEGQQLTAQVGAPGLWSRGARPDKRVLSGPQRRALAAYWTDVALIEHASVASFARLSLDLMAHCAPPELLLRCQVAAADEVRHARSAFALASVYGGTSVGPGPLDVPGRPALGLGALVVDVAMFGAVGETLAALLAAEQLRSARDAAVCAHLREVVRDESEHAELAWAVLRWALQRYPGLADPIRNALLTADWQGLLPPEGPAVARHGLLDRATARAALTVGMEQVVLPATQTLLDACAAARV